MTSIKHSNNLCLVTFHFPSSTPPSSSAASSSSPSSSSWTDEITKKIDELKNKEKNLNDLKEAKNGYLPEQYSKSLDSLPTQLTSLETVHKLAEFADQLDTKNNTNENILVNLCTGLEFFLGYNYETKGYTGKGIVYSDLDRLCDAVMGFLSSIITHVNNNENLTKYNDNLPGILEKIKQALYNRKTHFDSSIVAVSQGIDEWLENVTMKNENVIRPLESLLASINGHMAAYMKDKSITDQLKTWQGIAGQYIGDVYDSEQSLDHIDSNLKDRIQPRIQFVKQAVENFGATVDDAGLISSVEQLSDQFTAQHIQMKSLIANKIKIVQQEVNTKYSDIDRRISNLKEMKNTHIQLITEAVEAAGKDIGILLETSEKGFDQKYKTVITHKFYEIRDLLLKFTKKDVSDGKSELWTEFDIVNQQVNHLEADVTHGLDVLKREINGLDTEGIVKDVSAKLRDAVSKLSSEMIEPITKKSADLKEKYDAFDEQFGPRAEEFPTLKPAIYGEAGTSGYPENESLAGIIINLTNAIGGSGDMISGLQDAVGKFRDAAAEEIINAAEKAVDAAVGEFGTANTIQVKAFMHQFVASKTKLDSSMKKIRQQLDLLTKLPSDVQQIGKEADDIMTTLKTEIEALQSLIQLIKQPIGAANIAFDNAIRTFEDSLGSARTTTSMAMSMLQDQLTKAVVGAFNDLEEYLQKMFDHHKKAELRALHISVSDQIISLNSLIVDDMDTGLKGLMGNLQTALQSHPIQHSDTKLHLYATTVKTFFEKFLEDVTWQPDVSSYRDRLTPLADALSSLLSTMHQHNHFDHAVSTKLADLQSALNNLTPAKFAEASPLLNVVKRGVQAFHGELAKQYVSRYSGVEVGEMVKQKETSGTKTVTPPANSADNHRITEYGRKCAKVCVTMLYILRRDLTEFFDNCGDNGDWKDETFSLINSKKHNPLGAFLRKCGYEVATKEDAKTGELNFPSTDVTGKSIYDKLSKVNYDTQKIAEHLKACESNKNVKTGKLKKLKDFNLMDIMSCIQSHFDQYFQVGHYATFTARRQPCSVYEMCGWLAGLWYNPIFPSLLHDGINASLDDSDKRITKISGIAAVDYQWSYLTAYPRTVTYKSFVTAIEDVCSYAYELLTCVAGTGDACTTYACDYYDNSLKLFYPQSAEDCLDMLLDILRRLFPPLRFLHSVCGLSAKHYGWGQCYYGKGIRTVNWPCKGHSTEEPTGRPKSEPKCQAACQVESQPNCQPTSPLQSYLNDCLHGYLPHQVNKIGCKYECLTCPKNSPGMPCLTPLGFKAFSGSTRMGSDLWELLDEMFADDYISSLFCLIAKAPSTLAEHYNFSMSLIASWQHPKSADTTLIKESIESSIDSVSISLCDDPNHLTDALSNVYGVSQIKHNEENHTAAYADLSSLSMTRCSVNSSDTHCAPYLSSLSCDTYSYLAKKYSSSYLSWALYVPWTFHRYLESLLKALTDITCAEWGCPTCLNGDKCRKGEHGKSASGCQCENVVKCRGVMSTLYKYGFTFGNALALDNPAAPKECHKFYLQLQSVTTSQYFTKLFEECDNFLWTIRTPFSYLVLALWLLSLLYLIHIMVIRLDLLHIKSHLHSPSSHRIAAQSLLAAARVNKLNRVFYLQP